MADLLDVNAWLALATDAHIHHKRARHYWESEAAEKLVFCRVTQLALLRHLTNRSVMGDGVLTPVRAWAKYQEFLELPEIEFRQEPEEMESSFERLSARGRNSPNLWTDAYLAAFVKTADLRLVTFDQDFSNMGINALILSR